MTSSDQQSIADGIRDLIEATPRPTKTYHRETYDRVAKHHGFVGKGKTVLVTGGAAGIGYSISRAFAKAGVARLVIIARSAGPLEQAKKDLEAESPGTEVLTFQASIVDSKRMAAIVQELGTLDVLVLNASYLVPAHLLTELDTEDMNESLQTTVVAAWELVKAYLGTPIPVGGSKTVINVTTAGVQMRIPRLAAYGAAKAAVTQLMQHFAGEHADSGSKDDQRFFSIHPGAVRTPGAEKQWPAEVLDGIPWEDINLPADFSLWLAGPESSFLSGRFVWAEWDVDELIELKPKLAQNPQFLTIGLVL